VRGGTGLAYALAGVLSAGFALLAARTVTGLIDGTFLPRDLPDQADTAVVPEAEIRKPRPPATQVTPAAADSQRNGPTPVARP
jgi:hypothetical protein